MQSPPSQRCQYPYFPWNCFRATNAHRCVNTELKFSITSAVPVAVKAEWIQGKLISLPGLFFFLWWVALWRKLLFDFFALSSSCSPRWGSAHWSANTSSRSGWSAALLLIKLSSFGAYWNHFRNSLWPGQAPAWASWLKQLKKIPQWTWKLRGIAQLANVLAFASTKHKWVIFRSREV